MLSNEGGKGLIDVTISLGQIAVVASVVAGILTFYFSGQSNTGEHINRVETELNARVTKLEGDMNGRLQASTSALAERVGKNETRIAVIEQRQVTEDANIADARTSLNSFIVDIRQQFSRIVEQISDFRISIQSRDGQGTSIRNR